jgi:16S rRNA (adenine1518-N6/adenine1519-N6)-dimethyltransferase
VAKARKRFGQHFLEPVWVAKLVAAIAPAPTDRFIEIGPGRGAITSPLAERAERIVAVEVDRELADSLAASAAVNVAVIAADVLHVDLAEIAQQLQGSSAAPIRVVGNLPYNISSPILFRLLAASASGLFKDATLMLQKEVADRLTAKPGTGEYGVLTLSTMIRADVTQVLSLPPGAFRPAPSVRSSVVRLDFRPPPPDVRLPGLVVEIVRSVFTQRRKTLANALAPFATARRKNTREVLAAAGIDARRRPETLLLSDFARLAERLSPSTDVPARQTI